MSKTVCFFGSYNKTHRNNSLIKGLRENGYTVIECRAEGKFFTKYLSLYKKHRALKGGYDILFVGFPNHGLVLFAKLISRKPIFFDPFISLYNSIVEDRKQGRVYSILALKAYLLDRMSLTLADVVLTDTAAHGDYFSSTFHIKKSKCVVVPVGADDDIFHYKEEPRKNNNEFAVKFYGTYSPLQGVQHIVAAAQYTAHDPSIHFYLLGSGQTLNQILQHAASLKLTNITFLKERIPTAELVEFMRSADVCLGIFGGTVKSRMVVPHKVYDALALGKPVITGDTVAIREFFINEKNILLCKEADPKDLAEKIMRIKNESEFRKTIAREGKRLLDEKFTPAQIVKGLILAIEKY